MRARRVKAQGSSFEMGVVQYGVGFLFYLVEYFASGGSRSLDCLSSRHVKRDFMPPSTEGVHCIVTSRIDPGRKRGESEDIGAALF